jgi:hypothetical protein
MHHGNAGGVADTNESRRREVEAFCVDANQIGTDDEDTSPSGRYHLRTRTYGTAAHPWAFSRGVVTRVADGAIVCDLARNLGNFQCTFVEKDGREYLIAGRSYMSQTIVDLDRGIEHEPDGDHFDGGAFCWADCWLSPDGNTLAVDGCVWACPYEYRFFDFGDPARGWPSLPLVGDDAPEPADRPAPRWLDARTFEACTLEADGSPRVRATFVRAGDHVEVTVWRSDAERARVEAAARAEAAHAAWWDELRATDPMYRRLCELVRAHGLPFGDLDARPGDRRLFSYLRRAEPRASADFHWNLDAQTIRVRLYDRTGNHGVDADCAGSIDGIEEAIAMIARHFKV